MSQAQDSVNIHWIEPLYRFLLARTGEDRYAERLVARLVQDSKSMRHQDSIRLWRMALVRHKRFGRRESIDLSTSGQSEDTEQSLQDHILYNAQIHGLASRWASLPVEQADGLALVCFAGLDEATTARILGRSPERVRAWLAAHAGEVKQFYDLADRIPVPTHLIEQISKNMGFTRLPSSPFDWLKRFSHQLGWLRYRSQQWIPKDWAAPAILLAMILVGLSTSIFLSITAQPAKNNPYIPAQTPNPLQSFTLNNLAGSFLYPPSQDQVILADNQGQVFMQALDSGKRIDLTHPRLYFPRTDNSNRYPAASMSFDGSWLYLPPGDTGVAWLLSTHGEAGIRMYPAPSQLAWSPDSQKIAFVFPGSPSVVWITSMPGGQQDRLAQLPGNVLGMAWSHDGAWIGLAYWASGAPRANMTPFTLSPMRIARLSTQTGRIDILTTIDIYYWYWSQLYPYPLAWTDQDRSLWLIPDNLSVTIHDKTTHPLAFEPLPEDATQLQRQYLENLTTSSFIALSPDSRWLATSSGPGGPEVGSQSAVSLFSSATMKLFDPEHWPHMVSSAGVLAWTEEGNDLVISSQVSQLGYVYTLNIATLRTRTVAQDVVWIGLRSDLIRMGHAAALAVSKTRLPAPQPGEPWTTIQQPGLGLSLQVPAGWQLSWSQFPPSSANANLTISNFTWSSPLGYAELSDGDVYIVISRMPTGPGGNLEEWFNSIVQAPADFARTTIAGLDGYRQVKFNNPDHFQSIFFTTTTSGFSMATSGFSISWYSSTPETDAMMERILRSIQITE